MRKFRCDFTRKATHEESVQFDIHLIRIERMIEAKSKMSANRAASEMAATNGWRFVVSVEIIKERGDDEN